VAINLDSYLGVHASALKLREQRTELLARNLANADTPGYKAQDMDFRAALTAAAPAGSPAAMQATQSRHFATAGAAALEPGSTEAFLRYRWMATPWMRSWNRRPLRRTRCAIRPRFHSFPRNSAR
jgi:flagellar basal body rod protein FlgB